MNEALPPQNLDAEESVLGAMMLAGSAIEKVLDTSLSAEDFYRASHGQIFTAILSLYGKGEPVDGITVVDELGSTDLAERVYEIAGLAASASNAAHYANIVREMSVLRSLVEAGNFITRLGHDRPGSVGELVGQADAKILKLQSLLERKQDSVFTGKQLVEEFRYKLAHPEETKAGVNAPFSFLPPLQGSRLYVLGGYQADGKTAMALQFIASGCGAGKRVGFHSIEMGRADLTDRLVSAVGHLDYHDVRSGHVPERNREALEGALTQIEEWDWELIDDELVDPGVIRRSQRRGKYDLLIVDHLHRIPIKDRRHAREELEDSVRRITNIAREFDIPILLLAQLSRGDKRDPFPRPTMADLRGSGMIEAEAAMVLFVWRLRDKDHTPTTDAELIIAKNRYGALGHRNLHFRASQVRFTEALT